MNDLSTSLSFAASGMEAQAMRLRHVSENIANTDTLTGVSNRLALDEYIKYLKKKPEKFTQTALIIFDIDLIRTTF